MIRPAAPKAYTHRNWGAWQWGSEGETGSKSAIISIGLCLERAGI